MLEMVVIFSQCCQSPAVLINWEDVVIDAMS